MKRFKDVTQKILIVLLTLIMLTVSIPKPVQADFGGVLLSPFTSLLTSVADGFQWLLEWVMLGRPNDLMNKNLKNYESQDIPDGAAQVTITEAENGNLDGSLFGLDRVNVPDIQYTPENIFSNRVPALDINFIKPSVTGSEAVKERNIAEQLQDVIASWYVAIRTLAVVGLLSVLVYLGIRILITSVAADKAKYKKILLDWLVAVCLIFALHYIMSLILTAGETLTALISKSIGGDVYVTVEKDVVNNGLNIVDTISNDVTIKTNLMGYVRFMVQSTDFFKKVAYLALYIMLVVYNIRFTWVYLKRVVNMAFLTLIAPVVALTYPIDKVGDGKAQAFSLWIKEYIFNALLQPLHLLLYIVLLGSATQLATQNPLYAIVCLGFILAGEKLLKQMFGFSKAGAGTVGSLAGAAGVTALANKALMSMGRKPQEHGGKNGKVRTNDKLERQGKNEGANKDLKGFSNSKGIEALEAPETETPADNKPLDEGTNNEPKDTLQDLEQQRAELYNQGYTDDSDEVKAINDRINSGDFTEPVTPASNEEQKPDTAGSPSPRMTESALEDLGPEPETWRDLYEKDKQADYEEKKQRRINKAQDRYQHRMDKLSGELSRRRKIAAYKTWRGVKAAAPAVLKSAGRGALKAVPRAAAGLALGATAGVIAATSGDGEKTIAAVGGGIGVGAASGGSIFENTLGKVIQPEGIVDSYGAGKYGSAIEARNEKADKQYLRSQEHKEEYEKYFQSKMTKQEFDKATKSYREAGITDTKTIRKALKMEEYYKENNKNGDTQEQIRAKVQNIAQSYDNVSKKAVMGEDKKAEEAALKNIESQLTISDAKQRRNVSNEILQGFRDWYRADF